MSDANWAEIVTALGTIVIAGGTAVLAGAAIAALTSWKSALTSQRADECVAAARDLSGAIDRCRTIKKRFPQYNNHTQAMVSPAYDQIWAAWRRFDMAICAARRYHPKLSQSIPRVISDHIFEFEESLHRDWSKDQAAKDQSARCKENVDALCKPLETL
jgi:hypothetical protein